MRKVYEIGNCVLEQQSDNGHICVYDRAGNGYNFIGSRNVDKVKELLVFHDEVNEETDIEKLRDLAEDSDQVRRAIVRVLTRHLQEYKKFVSV